MPRPEVPGRGRCAVRWAAALALGAGVSCAPAVRRPVAGTWTQLVAPAAQAQWQPVAAADDPLASHRPEPLLCPTPPGYLLEFDDLEVDTGSCNYVALAQPAAFTLRAGDELRAILWHYPLTTADPGPVLGHAALLVGSDPQPLIEQYVPIPGPADVYDLTVPLPQDLDLGTRLLFHLHNHGANQWHLQPLLIRPGS
jgi:hypothetical protein